MCLMARSMMNLSFANSHRINATENNNNTNNSYNATTGIAFRGDIKWKSIQSVFGEWMMKKKNCFKEKKKQQINKKMTRKKCRRLKSFAFHKITRFQMCIQSIDSLHIAKHIRIQIHVPRAVQTPANETLSVSLFPALIFHSRSANRFLFEFFFSINSISSWCVLCDRKSHEQRW